MSAENQFDLEDQDRWRPEKHSVFRTFFGYFVPLFLVLSLFMLGLLGGDWLRTANLINANERLQVDIVKNTLTRDLENIGPDMRTLVQSRAFARFLDNENDETKAELEHTFSLFADHKRLYQQVRFIDTEGWERVRVDYRNGNARVVSDAQLQNKSERYYFKSAIALGFGDLFVSPIDLNIEHEKVELPYKPMMRFATPMFDRKGVKKGILILNYLADRMLNRFDQVIVGSWGHIEFLNQDGFWVRSHDRDREWGFMLGRDQRFSGSHEDVWETIVAQENGRIQDSSGLYNFTTLSPLSTIRESLRLAPEFEAVVHHSQDRVWKIVSDVPMEILVNRLIDNLVHVSGPVWLLLVIALLAGSWRLAVSKVARRRLQIEAALHAKVFSWVTEGAMITDADARILDVNAGFSTITGYSREEVIGQNPRLMSSGKHDAAFYASMWSSIAQRGFWEGEIFNRRKDGTEYCEWLRIAAAYDHRKHVQNYIALFSDISQRKQAEAALQQSKKELESHVVELGESRTSLEQQAADYARLAEDGAELNRLLQQETEVKNKFFTILSHDLKSPMNSLLGMTEVMALSADSMEKSKIAEYARDVNETGKRVLELIQNLLEWSRLQMRGARFAPGMMRLDEAVQETVDVLKPLARDKGVELHNGISKTDVYADHDMVRMIVRNLIANAVKFTPHDGTVTLSVRMSDDVAEVRVDDTGVGMTNEQIAAVFALDQKTSTVGTAGEKGTGLGLPLCKEMVERNGGRIWIESEPQKGTQVHFTLPSRHPEI